MVIGVLGQVIQLVVQLVVQVFKLEFVFIDLMNFSIELASRFDIVIIQIILMTYVLDQHWT